MTDALTALVDILDRAQALVARASNDFGDSSWEDAPAAGEDLATIRARIVEGSIPSRIELDVMFAPTGPLRALARGNGWGTEMDDLVRDFDAAVRAARAARR